MKKGATLLLSVILLFSLIIPINSFAEDVPAEPPVADAQPGEEPPAEAPEETPEDPPAEEQTEIDAPLLLAVNFEGAELVGEFSSDVFEYDLQITEHSDVVRLASYKRSDYNAQVKVYYLTNSSGNASGLVVRLENSGGANEYKFFFDTIKEIKKTPDASLMSLTFDYGELSPKFSADVFKYTLYLPKDLEVLNINAVTSDENAKVNTPSQVKIGTDHNFSLSVKITSSDGTNTAVYKLNVKRVDKTIAQIKTEMDSPDFVSFVEIPFYQTAPFYIGVGVALFLIALALVLFFTLRKKKPAVPAAEAPESLLPAPIAEGNTAKEKEAEIQPVPEEKTNTKEKAGTVPEQPAEKLPAAVPAHQPQKTETPPQPQKAEQKEQKQDTGRKQTAEPAAAAGLPGDDTGSKKTAAVGTMASATVMPVEEPKKKKKERKSKNGLFGKRKKQALPEASFAGEKEPDKAASAGTNAQEQPPAPETMPVVSQQEKGANENKGRKKAPAAAGSTGSKQDDTLQKTAESEKNVPLATDDWLDLDKYKKYK